VADAAFVNTNTRSFPATLTIVFAVVTDVTSSQPRVAPTG
jgi:hypothetical protein